MINKTLFTALSVLLLFSVTLKSEESNNTILKEIEKEKDSNKKAALYIRLADFYYKSGDSNKALENYQFAVPETGNKEIKYKVLIVTGGIFSERNEYAKAIDCYKKAIEIFDKKEEPRIKLADTYIKAELYKPALEQYLKALKKHKKSFDANYGIASLYFDLGSTNLALEYYKRALTISPKVKVYRSVSKCAEKLGNFNLAANMLKNIISIEGDYYDKISLGRIYEKLGEEKLAEESFSEAIKQNPDNLEGYLHLGVFYMAKEKYPPAGALIKIAKEKYPDKSLLYFIMARIYYKQGNISGSINEIRKAKNLALTKQALSYYVRFEEFLKTK